MRGNNGNASMSTRTDGRYIGAISRAICALAAPVSGCSAEEAEKVGAGDLGSISVGPQPGINRRMETRSGGGDDDGGSSSDERERERERDERDEEKFMCLRRVKGTRVERQVQRTGGGQLDG